MSISTAALSRHRSTVITRAVVDTLEARRLLASIAATSPTNGQQQIGVSANVTVRFNETMTAGSLTTSTLQLRDAGGNPVPSVVTYDAATKTATIDPQADLTASANYYTVKVVGGAAGVRDTLNVGLANDYAFGFTTGTPTFTEKTAFAGLIDPTSIQFADDGRIFVAEKRGVIKVYDNLADTTPTVFADLRTKVHNFWDRGLLGLALDPNFTKGRPYVYVLYTYDGDIGGTSPKYGAANGDSDAGASDGTSLVSCRLSKLTANGNVMTGTENVLISDWAQQFPSHSIGDLEFGPDGYLYASGGDGANFNAVDYGNYGNPFNDPVNEGGALRSQDVRSTGDPTSLHGSVIRIDPDTGAGAPGNPFASSTDANARRIIAFGLRNPYRLTFRPGTSELFIADTGWNTYEELNRIGNVGGTTATNFGWPAYEGPNKQPGYDALNLPLLESLYTSGGATSPWFSYAHSEKVVPGSSEPTGGSSPTGVTFYEGNTYAGAYKDALFFCDYARGQIYVMYRGVDGQPDPATRKVFYAIPAGSGIVDLTVGPDGNLYYADLYQGRVVRIDYTQPNPPPQTTVGKLGGMVIGTAGSYADDGYTRDMAVDGDLATFFDAPVSSGGWVGLNFGSAKVVRKINFAPRSDWPDRLLGGRFEGSNDPTFASATALYTVNSVPAEGVLTGVNVNTAGTAFRYVRFFGADDSAVNIAEMEFYDAAQTNTGLGDGLRGTYFDNVDFTGTSVTRIDPLINFNWAPTAAPVTGISPLTYSARWTGQVQAIEAGTYTLGLTGDDGVRMWVDGQLVIDKWIDQAPTRYTVAVTFAAGEKKDVRVEYFQNGQGATAKLEWKRPGKTVFDVIPTSQLFSTSGATAGTPPTPVVVTPTSNTQWHVGDTLTFSGGATDAEDGTLPASALTWQLILIHASDIDPNSTHEHLIQTFTGVTSGTFVAPDHEYPSWLELRLTAVDSGGQTTTVVRRIDPVTIGITLDSNVPGVALTFNDETVAGPFTRTWIVGSTASIAAPASVIVDGQTRAFTGWSDGGAINHDIVTPQGNVTYVATYGTTDTLAAPTAAVATAVSSTQVNVTWVDNAVGETGYRLERRVVGSGEAGWAFVANAAANATAYADITAAGGTAYDYRVRAESTTVQTDYATATAVITPLQAPTALASSNVTSDGVTLTWADNATTESGYRVERRPAGGTFATIASLGANVTTFTDGGLVASTAYEYRVRAFNPTTDSLPSNAAAVTTSAVVVAAPAAPTNLRANVATTKRVTLTWEDKAAGETGYRVERRYAGGTWGTIASPAANATTYTDTTSVGNVTYEYRVWAVNGSTAGTKSAGVTVNTAVNGAVAPLVPTGLTVTAVSVSALNLKWTDNATNETGYLIERRIYGTSTWAQVAVTGVNATAYVNSGLSGKTTYQYRIRAYYGSTYSAYGSTVNGKTL